MQKKIKTIDYNSQYKSYNVEFEDNVNGLVTKQTVEESGPINWKEGDEVDVFIEEVNGKKGKWNSIKPNVPNNTASAPANHSYSNANTENGKLVNTSIMAVAEWVARGVVTPVNFEQEFDRVFGKAKDALKSL